MQVAIKTDAGKRALNAMLTAARDAGASADQMLRFLNFGYIPQLKQLRFHAAARDADKPDGPDQIAYGGARGGGKSHTVFAQLALDDCMRMPGLKALYLRKVGKSAREQMQDLRQAVLSAVPNNYNRSNGEITLPNGSRIITGNFQTEGDIDKYLGIEYDVIAIEEANTLTQKKRQAVRNSNRTSKPGWRPRMYLTFNPGGIGHGEIKRDFVEPYRRGRETFSRFIPATVDDNRFVDPDYKRKLDENTGWMLRAYRYGDFDIAAGQFFTNWAENHHVIEPFRVTNDMRIWASFDYGFNHYTSCHLFCEHDGTVYVIGEHAAQKRLPEQHAPDILSLADRVANTRSNVQAWYAGPDVFSQRGEEKTIAQRYESLGITFTTANNDRVGGAAELLSMLGNPRGEGREHIPARLKIFNTCVRLIEALPAMVHDPNRPEDVLKIDTDEDGNGGDDAYDSCRYGIASRPQHSGGFSMSYRKR